jgi:hypothetical protein
MDVSARFDAFYVAADGIIKPAVFGGLAKLGWKLVPSASPVGRAQ